MIIALFRLQNYEKCFFAMLEIQNYPLSNCRNSRITEKIEFLTTDKLTPDYRLTGQLSTRWGIKLCFHKVRYAELLFPWNNKMFANNSVYMNRKWKWIINVDRTNTKRCGNILPMKRLRWRKNASRFPSVIVGNVLEAHFKRIMCIVKVTLSKMHARRHTHTYTRCTEISCEFKELRLWLRFTRTNIYI